MEDSFAFILYNDSEKQQDWAAEQERICYQHNDS